MSTFVADMPEVNLEETVKLLFLCSHRFDHVLDFHLVHLSEWLPSEIKFLEFIITIEFLIL